MLGIIAKSFEFLNEELLLKLYATMFCLILEYGKIISGPHFKLDQIAAEVLPLDCYHLYIISLQERLHHLKLPSLKY